MPRPAGHVVLTNIRLGGVWFLGGPGVATGQSAALIMISVHARDEYADLIAESPAPGFAAKVNLPAAATGRILSMR